MAVVAGRSHRWCGTARSVDVEEPPGPLPCTPAAACSASCRRCWAPTRFAPWRAWRRRSRRPRAPPLAREHLGEVSGVHDVEVVGGLLDAEAVLHAVTDRRVGRMGRARRRRGTRRGCRRRSWSARRGSVRRRRRPRGRRGAAASARAWRTARCGVGARRSGLRRRAWRRARRRCRAPGWLLRCWFAGHSVLLCKGSVGTWVGISPPAALTRGRLVVVAKEGE